MAADPRPALPHDRGGAETRDNSEARLRAVLALFDEHYEAVFRFARRSVDDSLAEDVTQEVFARLMRLEGIEHREINGSYLLKIASNLIKRRYQRERRFGEIARHAAGRHADSAVGDRPGTRGSERADRAARRRRRCRHSAVASGTRWT
jgi:DNA-directed RNA polymerase specialized sigma24 family protein